jgi:hypothetical protein
MIKLYLEVDFNDISRPVELLSQETHLGVTDYYHVARISVDAAQVLNADHGVPWLTRTPDWEDVFKQFAALPQQQEG